MITDWDEVDRILADGNIKHAGYEIRQHLLDAGYAIVQLSEDDALSDTSEPK